MIQQATKHGGTLGDTTGPGESGGDGDMTSQGTAGGPDGPREIVLQPAWEPGELGRRVCGRREELKLSRQQLADLAGVSVPYVQYLETHPVRPSRAALRQLAAALLTTPEMLIGADAGPADPAPRPALHKLTAVECYELLSLGGVGRVAFTTADGPVMLPVNYAMAAQTVVFRTAPDTRLARYLDCAAAFEADHLDEALSQGWSVLVTGRAVRVTKEAEVRHLEQPGAVQPWADGARDVYVRIIPHQISGRRISG